MGAICCVERSHGGPPTKNYYPKDDQLADSEEARNNPFRASSITKLPAEDGVQGHTVAIIKETSPVRTAAGAEAEAEPEHTGEQQGQQPPRSSGVGPRKERDSNTDIDI
eukprot:TRINITY_DN20622_c0_g1_i1.p1 TRINITY_DN20622_c0_g1~~TRINITY_DN20622_c0_g1_i1.p1  ORF type:complete len:109 (-),score=9.59 TRINITY_DN20622_c0_g1_i1:342-668(-)